MMRVVDRYLSSEVVLPFLSGLVGFVLIEIGTLLFNGLIEAAIQAHAPLGLLAQLLFLKLPLFVVLAMPIATLFGVSLGASRLSRESELIAIRLAGVPLNRLLMPFLAVGTGIAVADYLIEENVVPVFNARASEMIQRMWVESTLPSIRADTFFHAGQYWFYLGSVQKTVQNRFSAKRVMVYEIRGSGYPSLTVADDAMTDGTDWVLRNWRTIDLESGHENLGNGREIMLHLPIAGMQFLTGTQAPEDMSSAQLRSQIEKWSRSGVRIPSLVLAYQLKYSIPFGCIVVVLISLPLAIRFARAGTFVGLLLSIVLFFFYYNTYFLARLLGENSILPPTVAAWAHNALFGVAGLVLLWREE